MSRSRGRGARSGGTAPRRRASAAAVAEALLWLLVVLAPLAVVPALREPFTLPKLVLAEWLALASVLVLAAGAAWRARRSAAPPAGAEATSARLLGNAWSRPAARLAAPLLAAAVVSWLATAHRAHAATAMAGLAIAAVALVGWSAGLEAPRLRRVLAVLALPTVPLALLAILQYHGVYQVFEFASGLGGGRAEVSSLAGNAGHLGAFLAFACVVLQALLPAARSSARRAALLAILALGLYALVLTQTLAAVAAVLFGSAAVWATLLPRRRVLLAGAALAAAAVVAVAVVAPLRARVVEKASQLAAGEVNALLTGRLDGWRAALWMAREHPVAGVGPGAYVSEFSDAKLALLDRGTPFYRGHVQPTFANAHNEVLEVAAEWGLVGVAALLWALWVALAAVRRVGRGGGTRSSAAGPAAASDAALARGGLAVLAVLALVHFPFRIALTGYPALLWLAWTLRRAAELGVAEGAAPEATAAAAAAGRRRRPARWLAWGVVLLLAAGLALETERARRLMRASRLLNAAERTTVALAARGRLPGALLWANLRLLREAEELDPASVGVVVAAAGQQLLLDRPREAVDTYRRALALEPRPEVWINLGRAQWAAGERDEALASWTAAVRLDRRLLDSVPPEARAQVEPAAAGGGAAR